ncbi:putative nuclear matrix constituent protein 1-like protein [Sesbania bispinosa]|nr:putative nuclear matrix constituent protein 1-like protein [Sesbania bispinosa]
MFTPQRVWSGWSLTPSKSGTRAGTGSGSNREMGPNSGDGTGAKGKGVAVVENGGNLDREVLVERVSSLEKEIS